MMFKTWRWISGRFKRGCMMTRWRAAHLRLGRRGERIARHVLVEYGLEYLVRNYRHRRGEIDLIFRDGSTLCFVEVKTRHKRVNVRPSDAVGSAKRENVIRTAESYLRAIGQPPVLYRFDIVEVIFSGRHPESVTYMIDAFSEKNLAHRGRF